MGKATYRLERAEETIRSVCQVFHWIAGAMLMAMMCLTCADVVLRVVYRPILGTFEIVGFLGCVVVSFAIAYTTAVRGHIAVELVVSRLPPRAQAIVDSITQTVGIVLFSLVAWQSILYASDLQLAGEVSQTLKVPYFPLIYGVALGCVLICLVLLADLIKSLAGAVRK